MTPDKPAGEMPDEVTVSRIRWEDGYILTLMDYGDCPDPARQTARYLRADKPDSAAAREALEDFNDKLFVSSISPAYAHAKGIKAETAAFILSILQREAGV